MLSTHTTQNSTSEQRTCFYNFLCPSVGRIPRQKIDFVPTHTQVKISPLNDAAVSTFPFVRL